MDLVPYSGFNKISVDHRNAPWKAPKLEDEIERLWQEKTREAQESGRVLFNVPVIRARTMWQEGNRLIIETQVTDYKHHVATRENPELRKRANLLYAASILIVEDNEEKYQVFGVNEGGSEAAGLGKLNVVAGVVEPTDIGANGRLSIDCALYREMEEEVGLVQGDYQAAPAFVVVEEKWRHPSLVYVARTSMGIAGVREKYNAAVQRDLSQGKKPEHGDLVFIKDKVALFREAIGDGRLEGRVNIIEAFYFRNVLK